MSEPRTVGELLDEARASLERVTAIDAARAAADGALIVDIRPSELRATHGTIPGALIIDRNVLEWRLDPASEHRIPEITGYEQAVIVVCQEGYASSLAAQSLQHIGLRRATDLIGGFRAWEDSRLPIERQ